MISTITYFHYYLFRCFSKCLKTSNRQFRASWVRYYLFSFTIQVCAGIAEVMGSNPVRAWNFFQVLFTTTRFSSVLSCEDLLISSFHRSANMWIFIYLKSLWHGSFNITYHIRTTQSTNNSQLYDILALYVQGKLLAMS